MATCPDCGGYLNTRHKCRGVWRLRLALTIDLLLAALAGGILAAAVFLYVDGHVSSATVAVGALLAAILRWTTIQGEPRGPRPADA